MTITATARDAGRNVIHTVTTDENVEVYSPTRRSAHHYPYAIVKRNRDRSVTVLRWSRSSRCVRTKGEFPIPVIGV